MKKELIYIAMVNGLLIGVIIFYFLLSKPIKDYYLDGIHYKEINGNVINVTKDSFELIIYKKYEYDYEFRNKYRDSLKCKRRT